MEECRFETSELQASFMMATPLWSESWSLCDFADRSRSIQIQQIAGILYVALPEVEITQPDNLVVLAEDGLFSALSKSLPSDEPPPMVNGAVRDLFFSSAYLQIQSQITQELAMEERKLVVITGHASGGAVAALTALWLLSQPSKPSFRLLCITYGSPLLGNQSLSTSISRSRLAHNFCNVVSIHDLAPRRNGDLWPFGTFLFCSDNGGVCLDNAASVRRMFLILNSATAQNIEERPRYGHYVSTLSHQFLISRSFSGGSISDNSYQAGVALAVESLGLYNDHPSGVSAKECIEAATTISRAPILRSSELAIDLGKVMRWRLDIQWYKDKCDASAMQLGYYDNFKVMSKSEIRVIKSRILLAKFWDGVLEMLEKNELPFDFHLGKKWVFASQFYQLLTEPLDIAYFYKYDYSRAGGHYMENGNRPKRYVEIDKWWKERGQSHKEKRARTTYASTTQDTCFWAKLEEAKECLDDMRSESIDAQRRSFLWEKIVGFEKYADTLVKMKEVSVDVLARESSYIKWVKNLSDFRSHMGNMVVDESNAMEI